MNLLIQLIAKGPSFVSVRCLVHIWKRFKFYIPANVVHNLQIMLSHI